MPDTTSEPKTEKVKRTDQQKSTHRSSAAQQVDLAGSFMISERNIHTKWMTLMILVQIANHPHSQIAFNKTTGMGITPALFLPAALNITLLASIANNVSLNTLSVCLPTSSITCRSTRCRSRHGQEGRSRQRS
ncbi:hypothetical protein BLNAU_23664 [Blattamonas nauphoetae]|uniref:Uncharacterized protein n=1 Tax=Blattamonas nauphoetae TaxID=2049346 RepID=A0ABQ9WPK5_9EUKA|nr:hypothetical protein BLNAU_23664 [Blattamonas nauphoetae]